MARLLRIQFPGAIYHVTARGNERRAIFKDDRDRERFLQNLARAQELQGARLYLVCLMPNHFHLLVETPGGLLSAVMACVLTSYAVYYNRRHRRVGHLTQGRDKAQLGVSYGTYVETGLASQMVLAAVAVEFGMSESALRKRSRNEAARGAVAWALVRYAGLTQRAAAEVLGMGTGAAVSQQVANWRRAVLVEPRCRTMESRLGQKLAAVNFNLRADR